MNPDDYETLERLADMYRKRGQKQKAFDAYERLHVHAPYNFLYLDYLYTLGTALRKSSDFQIEILNKMHKLQPDNLRVAELLGKTGSVGRAIEAFEQSAIIRDYGFSFDKSYTIQSGENKGKRVYHYRDENSLTIEAMLRKDSETIEHYAMVVPIDTPPTVAGKMLVFLGNLIDKSVLLSEVAGFVRTGMDGHDPISKELLKCRVRVTPTPVAGIAVVTVIPQ